MLYYNILFDVVVIVFNIIWLFVFWDVKILLVLSKIRLFDLDWYWGDLKIQNNILNYKILFIL